MCDLRRLRVEPITLEPERDDRIVVRPNGTGLIVIWIKRRVARRERTNSPARPHVGCHQTLLHFFGAFWWHNSRQKAVPSIGGDGENLLLIAVQRQSVKAEFVIPKSGVEMFKQRCGLCTQFPCSI